jgi:PhnB protein
MESIDLESYLFFPGQCREAMAFYQSIFGGDLEMQTYGEIGPEVPNEQKDMIMHASLKHGLIDLMASDGTDTDSKPQTRVSLSLGGTDEDKMRDIFSKLGEGGKTDYPLKKEFWGDIFGSLVDKYGINWMMNIASESDKA